MTEKNETPKRGEHKVSDRLAKKLAEIRSLKQREPNKDQKSLNSGRSENAFYRGPYSAPERLAKKISENRARREGEALLAREKTFDEIRAAIQVHFSALSRNLRRSVKFDDYKSITEDSRYEEAQRFFKSVQIELLQVEKLEAAKFLIDEVEKAMDRRVEEGFDPFSYPKNGHAFEHWLAEALSIFGWSCQVTTGSGDQGVDLIARRDGRTIAIQAKRYTGSVGNKAIQEIYAGARYLEIESAAVITTTAFTKSATELSKSLGVKLVYVQDIPNLVQIMEGSRLS